MKDPADDLLQRYEPVSKEAAAYTKGLMLVREKLGNPDDCSVNTGWVMLDNIVQVWMKCWPREKDDWIKNIKEDLSVERSIQASVKAGGYFPMSYPTRLYKLIRALLPHQKLNEKHFIHDMIQRYPFLKSTNYKV